MSEDQITTENLTKELLKSVLDAAFMETRYDQEGDLVVKDSVSCFVLPNEAKSRIKLMTLFGFKPSATRLERLECMNNINYDYAIVKTYARPESNALTFSYDLNIEGGLSKKAFVLSLKRFCAIVRPAVQEYGQNVGE